MVGEFGSFMKNVPVKRSTSGPSRSRTGSSTPGLHESLAAQGIRRCGMVRHFNCSCPLIGPPIQSSKRATPARASASPASSSSGKGDMKPSYFQRAIWSLVRCGIVISERSRAPRRTLRQIEPAGQRLRGCLLECQRDASGSGHGRRLRRARHDGAGVGRLMGSSANVGFRSIATASPKR